MPSLNELRRKIKSIKSTQQITKAMKMIAGARLSRAQRSLNDSRYFADNAQRLLAETVSHFQNGYPDTVTQGLRRHPLVKGNVSNKVCLVVATSDKGLCGAFNSNVLRRASEFMEGAYDKQISLFVIGKRAHDYFSRRRFTAMNTYLNLSGKLDFQEAQGIATDLCWFYLNENISELIFIYNDFKSIMKQQVLTRKVLPFDLDGIVISRHPSSYIYEPRRERIAKLLLFKCISYSIYSILNDSYVAELAARMVAMDEATKNAHDLIESLTLEMNKVRQAGITRELADIVGTAEVLR